MKWRRLIRSLALATPIPEYVARRRGGRSLSVLGYHRIHPLPDDSYPFNPQVFSATPEEFAREIKYLRAHYDVISMADLCQGLRDPARLPPRPAVITFDDGYVDNYTYAFPLLREAGLPACFFVCTSLVGTRLIPWQEQWVCCLRRSKRTQIPSPFGRDDPPYNLEPAERAASINRFRSHMRRLAWSQMSLCLERLIEKTGVNPSDLLTEPLFMSWDAAREMAAAGMEFGGHTRTHPILSRVEDPQTLRDEIVGCFDDLKQQIGRPPLAFAYPSGDVPTMSQAADEEIRRAGFEVSFSFVPGYAPRRPESPYRLPRIHATCGADFQAFRLTMATSPLPVARSGNGSDRRAAAPLAISGSSGTLYI